VQYLAVVNVGPSSGGASDHSAVYAFDSATRMFERTHELATPGASYVKLHQRGEEVLLLVANVHDVATSTGHF
ncbi:hypothetical protein T484DRAFT_1803591, partial [Baffinella frigidus]